MAGRQPPVRLRNMDSKKALKKGASWHLASKSGQTCLFTCVVDNEGCSAFVAFKMLKGMFHS